MSKMKRRFMQLRAAPKLQSTNNTTLLGFWAWQFRASAFHRFLDQTPDEGVGQRVEWEALRPETHMESLTTMAQLSVTCKPGVKPEKLKSSWTKWGLELLRSRSVQ